MRTERSSVATLHGRSGTATRHASLGRVARASILALCVVLGIAAALAGCGNPSGNSTGNSNSNSNSNVNPPDPQNASGSGGGPQPTLQDNPASQQDSAGGLLLNGSLSCADNLVLASDQSTYSDADVQNLLAYISTQNPSGPLPSILTSVPGSVVGGEGPDACTADVTVTNDTSQTVTIVGGGVRNVSAPVTNTFEYRTVDFCAMQQQGLIPSSVNLYWCGRGGGPTCSYDLQVPLSSGDVGTDYVKPFAVDGCKTISLPPAQAADITMEFQPDQPLIYLVNPERTVADGSGTHNVVFANWSSTLAYASNNQMPCYELSQDTFSLETGASDCS